MKRSSVSATAAAISPTSLHHSLLSQQDQNRHLRQHLSSLQQQLKLSNTAIIKANLTPGTAAADWKREGREVDDLLVSQRLRLEQKDKEVRKLRERLGQLSVKEVEGGRGKKKKRHPLLDRKGGRESKAAASRTKDDANDAEKQGGETVSDRKIRAEKVRVEVVSSPSTPPAAASRAAAAADDSHPVYSSLSSTPQQRILSSAPPPPAVPPVVSAPAPAPPPPQVSSTPATPSSSSSLPSQLSACQLKLSLLSSHFDHLQASFRAEKTLNAGLLAQLEQQKEARRREQERRLQGEEELKERDLEKEQTILLRAELEEERKGRQLLEERVRVLMDGMWGGDVLERERVEALLRRGYEREEEQQAEAAEQERRMEELRAVLRQTIGHLQEKNGRIASMSAQAQDDRRQIAKLRHIITGQGGLSVEELQQLLDREEAEEAELDDDDGDEDDRDNSEEDDDDGDAHWQESKEEKTDPSAAARALAELQRRNAELETQRQTLTAQLEEKTQMMAAPAEPSRRHWPHSGESASSSSAAASYAIPSPSSAASAFLSARRQQHEPNLASAAAAFPSLPPFAQPGRQEESKAQLLSPPAAFSTPPAPLLPPPAAPAPLISANAVLRVFELTLTLLACSLVRLPHLLLEARCPALSLSARLSPSSPSSSPSASCFRLSLPCPLPCSQYRPATVRLFLLDDRKQPTAPALGCVELALEPLLAAVKERKEGGLAGDTAGAWHAVRSANVGSEQQVVGSLEYALQWKVEL